MSTDFEHIHYVVRNCIGEEVFVYPVHGGFKFVHKKYDYLPKPQSYIFQCYRYLVCDRVDSTGAIYKNHYDVVRWPKKFRECVSVETLNFDCTLDEAIGSVMCELDWGIYTYPEAFIVKGGIETLLPQYEAKYG